MPIQRPAPPPAPGPRGGEMLRSIRVIRRDPLAFLESMRAAYGPIVQFPIPRPPTYLVTDPEAVRRVLVGNSRAYGKRTLQYSTLSLVTGEGLLTADTEVWRAQRPVIQPAFHRASLDLVAGHVSVSVERLLTRWTAQDGAIVDVDEAMMRLALEVVGSALFGSDLSDDAERLAQATLDALEVVVRKAQWPLPAPVSVPTPTNVVLRRAVGRLDVAVDAILDDRARHPLGPGDAPRDMLDLLLAAHADDGSTLSRQQVRDQIVTFIVAGHETVASALTWAWQLLVTHPDVLWQVRAEVDSVCPTGVVSFDDLTRLPLTTAVLDEVLRLYPPAWLVTRRSLEPDVLAGFQIPADALIIVSPWLMHRDAGLWPDPDAFDPSRFVDEHGSRRRDVINSAAYLPFGAGPRLCVGRDMALLEGVLVLASLVGRVDLVAVGPAPRAVPMVTIRPDGGLSMRVRIRARPRPAGEPGPVPV